MSTLLGSVIQPPLLTLLSSSASPALSPLWHTHGPSSSVSVLADTHPFPSSSTSTSASASTSRRPEKSIRDPVIQIASPLLRSTYIQLGTDDGSTVIDAGGDDFGWRLGGSRGWALGSGQGLGYLSFQLRRIGGGRECAIEVGLADARGIQGVVRLSTFKKEPSIHTHRPTALVHLPLTIPESGMYPFPWSELTLNLSTLLALFTQLREKEVLGNGADEEGADDEEEEESEEDEPSAAKRRRTNKPVAPLPSTQYGNLRYIRIYANCRVHRVWLSAEADRTLDGIGAARALWALHAA